MEQKIDLLALQLKEIHVDVRALRTENHNDHVRLTGDIVDLQKKQAGDDARRHMMGFISSAIIPFVVALFTAGLAIALALP